MKRRIQELKTLARIVAGMAGELRYQREILAHIFMRVSGKCEAPFCSWLQELSRQMQDMDGDFNWIWKKHADKLYAVSGLAKADMEYIYNLGRVLGYLDVQAQEQALSRLEEEIVAQVRLLEVSVRDRMRVCVALGGAAGILLLLVLL